MLTDRASVCGLYLLRGIPDRIRSEQCSEFVAKAVQEWITAIGAKTAYIEPAQGKRLPAPPATLTHARLSDFIVDAAAAFIGLGLTSAAARFSRYKIRL